MTCMGYTGGVVHGVCNGCGDIYFFTKNEKIYLTSFSIWDKLSVSPMDGDVWRK